MGPLHDDPGSDFGLNQGQLSGRSDAVERCPPHREIGKEFDRSPSTTFPRLDALSDWVRALLRSGKVVKEDCPKKRSTI